jgi:hypothetical protein
MKLKLNYDNADALSKGERMMMRTMHTALAAVDLRRPLNNKQYMLIYTAFQNVGDLARHWLGEADRNRVTELYERLKGILRDGHPTMGHAMVARGIKQPEDFDL